MTNDLAELDVFYGDLTVNRAYVYARLPRPADDAGLSLVGQVRGPRCLHAETLPLTSPLIDLGPGPTLLAQALIPDPCFWSPDLPAIYDVTVNLLRGTEMVASARREIGLRSLGVRGRNFALESKRWVLRGVSTRSTVAEQPRAWHELSAAMVAAAPDGETLAEASQWGVMTVVELRGSANELLAGMRRVTLQPGVALAVIRGTLTLDFRLSQVAPNLVLAQPLHPQGEPNLQPWASVLLADASDPAFAQQVAAQSDRPVIAVRPLSRPLPIAEARAACDFLQRDLAPLGQFAGYIV